MSIIQAYKSDSDGKLFEDKANYISHLKKLAIARRGEKRAKQVEAQREQFMVTMGQVASIAELEKFIKDNWKWFWANGSRRNQYRMRKGEPDFHEYIEVSFSNVYWKEDLSNSHSCPRGGVENFNSSADYNKGKPTSYPGWCARISIKVRPPMSKHKKDPYMHDGWGSDYFDTTIIHTGTGGGGSGKDCKSYAYDVSLWAADFPVMHEIVRKDQWLHAENERRQRAWNTVGGKGAVTKVTDVPEDWTCPDPFVATFY